MSAKEAKREAKKKQASLESRNESIQRRRVEKAKRKIFEQVAKEFNKVGSVHDIFFHFMLKNVNFAARFLKAYLPKKLRDALNLDDLSRIKILSTDFYESRGKKHVADLIFLIPYRGKNEYVALTLMIEHKAQSGAAIDRKTVMQTLKYVVLEVEDQLNNQTDDKIVFQPLIVLFYTGKDASFEAPSWESSFPLHELLQDEELQEAQIRFKPLCVNLTRLFLEKKLSPKDFLRVMPEIMARASLKRLNESFSTLFDVLAQIENWTEEDNRLFAACLNYINKSADQPLSNEEMGTLQQSAKNKEMRKTMGTFFALVEEKGKIEGRIEGKKEGKKEGKIEGKLETIQTIASLRFPEPSQPLTPLLKKFNDLELLEQIRQFAMTAPSLTDVENYAEKLLPIKSRGRRVARKQTA